MGCRELCGEAYAENLSHAECSLGKMDLIMPYSCRAVEMSECNAMSISSSRPMAGSQCQLVLTASGYGYYERQQRRPAETLRGVAGEG